VDKKTQIRCQRQLSEEAVLVNGSHSEFPSEIRQMHLLGQRERQWTVWRHWCLCCGEFSLDIGPTMVFLRRRSQAPRPPALSAAALFGLTPQLLGAYLIEGLEHSL
jgi:hypothetical protein